MLIKIHGDSIAINLDEIICIKRRTIDAYKSEFTEIHFKNGSIHTIHLKYDDVMKQL